MTLTRRQARQIGLVAIAGVLLLQAFSSFNCYQHDLIDYVLVVGLFLLPPLLPALLSLPRANPLGAVGACALLAPWLIYAYYFDCIRPYSGGGASMIYIAVLFYGTPGSIIGALITPWLCNKLGLTISEQAT